MRGDEISLSVIRRLPRYHRFLGQLEREGIVRISSKELSERMGLSASQIRQDLNCFGGFGQQGYGYNVSALRGEIAAILGLSRRHRAILIGLGELGRAIAGHVRFSECACELIGLFDTNPFVAGRDLNGLAVHHIDTLAGFCHQEQPEIAILCVPGQSAPVLARQLAGLGVKGFWNFSHCELRLDIPGTIVENVCLADSLLTLAYELSQNPEQKDNLAAPTRKDENHAL